MIDTCHENSDRCDSDAFRRTMGSAVPFGFGRECLYRYHAPRAFTQDARLTSRVQTQRHTANAQRLRAEPVM